MDARLDMARSLMAIARVFKDEARELDRQGKQASKDATKRKPSKKRTRDHKSAYVHFSGAYRNELKARRAKVEKDMNDKDPNRWGFAQYSKEIGKIWKAMTDVEKAPYVEKADKEKAAALARRAEAAEAADAADEAAEEPVRKKARKAKRATKAAKAPASDDDDDDAGGAAVASDTD